LLAVGTVKPQIAIPLAGWLILWSFSRIESRWKFMVAFAATLAALVGSGELLLPGWPREFYAALVAYRGYTRHLSPLDELATPTFGFVLSLIITAAVIVVCWRARRLDPQHEQFRSVTSLVLAANLLVIPTIAPYNQLLLLPGILLLLRSWDQDCQVNRAVRVLRWIGAGCLVWPWITAIGLTLISLITSAVERLWQVPLWTSILIPIPIAACLGLSVYQLQRKKTSTTQEFATAPRN
jgi:hypothetical protein